MKHYHYIFGGAGLSSLMTVYRMAVSGSFNDKSILILDPDTKKNNDRTWCFWQKGENYWDAIIDKRWTTAVFANDAFSKDLDFEGYRYQMIHGIDFYNYVLNELRNHDNIVFVQQRITDYADSGFNVLVKTQQENYTCNKFFNSIYNPKVAVAQTNYPVLQQHFIGWRIRTDKPVFNSAKPVFMDFSVPQKGNTRFMYVLPYSATEALVEYTLFSKDLLPDNEYEQAIDKYVKNLGATSYKVIDTERGSIPMTSYPFWKNNTKNSINIGSAGGWTKASTGYTFRHADKKSQLLVQFLLTGKDFTSYHKKNKFWFYDLLLLDILARTNHKGSQIFSAMFKSGKAALIFKFLDEETTFAEDLKVILKCPKMLFVKALFRRIGNL